MKWAFAVVLAVVLPVLGVCAFGARQSPIAFPEDYREWTHVKSALVGPDGPDFETNGGYHHFYANDKAMEGYRSSTFPDGSILIDDGLEATEKGGVTTEGARRRVAVMVKDSRRFRDTQNWGFEVFPRDSREGVLTAAGRQACLACHQQAGQDLVYSRFRK